MTIASRSLSDLSPRLLQLYEQAREAYMAGNTRGAGTMLAAIVGEDPGCCAARKALRAAQLDLFGERPRGLRALVIALRTLWPLSVQAPILLRQKRAVEALALAEGVLAVDPGHRRGLLLLAKAGDLAGLPQVGEDALELAVKLYPDEARCWRTLADHCMTHGNGRRAVAALRELRRRFPDDLEIKAELNQAKAIVAMGRESWEKATQFGKEPSSSLSVGNSASPGVQRNAAPEETPRSDLVAAAEGHAPSAGQGDRSAVRPVPVRPRRSPKSGSLSGLIEAPTRLSDDDVAARKGLYDDAIAQWREYGRANPERVADAEEAIAGIEVELQCFLTQYFESLVKRYPTDPRYRFDLGELLWKAGEWDYAMEQFQACRKHPHFELRSMIYLGRCMMKKGLLDLSLAQFEAAVAHRDYANLGTARMAADYDLAMLYVRVGRHDEGDALFKRIYAEDITYRDVAQRVERMYAGVIEEGADAVATNGQSV